MNTRRKTRLENCLPAAQKYYINCMQQNPPWLQTGIQLSSQITEHQWGKDKAWLHGGPLRWQVVTAVFITSELLLQRVPRKIPLLAFKITFWLSPGRELQDKGFERLQKYWKRRPTSELNATSFLHYVLLFLRCAKLPLLFSKPKCRGWYFPFMHAKLHKNCPPFIALFPSF